MGIDYYKAYVAHMKLTRNPTLIDNPKCVKETINTMFWKAEAAITKYNESADQTKYIILAIATGVIFILSLTLFTIYFKGKSNRETEETIETLAEDQ
jgi:hypothetical protein